MLGGRCTVQRKHRTGGGVLLHRASRYRDCGVQHRRQRCEFVVAPVVVVIVLILLSKIVAETCVDACFAVRQHEAQFYWLVMRQLEERSCAQYRTLLIIGRLSNLVVGVGTAIGCLGLGLS